MEEGGIGVLMSLTYGCLSVSNSLAKVVAGSEGNEFFADMTSGLRISGSEKDCTEGQPNRLFDDFCFVEGQKDVAVGVPGMEMEPPEPMGGNKMREATSEGVGTVWVAGPST